MKQEEKSRKSREHILSYAFAEFAEQGYSGASINSICSAGKISKGLLYHYYADKNTLYLACAEKCYCELTEYLSAHLDTSDITPEKYFNVRLAYFVTNPFHQKLFCDTVVNPPDHLRKELSSCRSAFDRMNEAMLTAILNRETLAEGVSIQDAIYQLKIFEDFVSTRLKNAGPEAKQAEEHNRLCQQSFYTMLYGLIART